MQGCMSPVIDQETNGDLKFGILSEFREFYIY